MAGSASFFDTSGQTPSQLMSRMDNNGIDNAVIFPVNSGMLAHEEHILTIHPRPEGQQTSPVLTVSANSADTVRS